MKHVDEIRVAYDERVGKAPDLNDMIALPRSPAQFESTVRDIALKLELTPSARLLDVGCGNAIILRSLLPLVSCAVGIDISSALLAVAKSLLPQAVFVQSEASRIPFKDSAFDRVLTYSTFMHFPSKKYALESICELCRVCSAGGIVLIGDVPNKALRRNVISWRWEIRYRFHVLIGRHPGPSIFNPLRWRFYNLDELAHFAKSLGHEVKILSQPPDLLCANHRADLVIRVRKRH